MSNKRFVEIYLEVYGASDDYADRDLRGDSLVKGSVIAKNRVRADNSGQARALHKVNHGQKIFYSTGVNGYNLWFPKEIFDEAKRLYQNEKDFLTPLLADNENEKS